jgi:hypothetical protein
MAARAAGGAVVAPLGVTCGAALGDGAFGVGGAPEEGAATVRAGAGGAALPAGAASAATMAIRGATPGVSGGRDGAASSVRSEAAAGTGAGARGAGTRAARGAAAAGAVGAGATVDPLPSGGLGEGVANHKPLARKDAAAKATATATAVRRNAAGTRSGNVATFSLSIRQTAAAVASPPAVPGRMRKSSCSRRPSIASLRSKDGDPGDGIPSTRHSPLITGPRQGARPHGPISGGAAAALRPRLQKTTSAAHRLFRSPVA